LAVQSVSNENVIIISCLFIYFFNFLFDIYKIKQKDFRISATGVVTDVNKSTQIVKKLKVIGTPHQIFRKTAFIQVIFV
jgi:hypothetical protein